MLLCCGPSLFTKLELSSRKDFQIILFKYLFNYPAAEFIKIMTLTSVQYFTTCSMLLATKCVDFSRQTSQSETELTHLPFTVEN